MAQYDITAEVTEILAAGYTPAQVKATCRLYYEPSEDGSAIATNRREQSAVRGMLSDVRSLAARRAPAAPALATDAQVAYITDLLHRHGDNGGYVTVTQYCRGGQVDTAALHRLTRAQASQMIDSLRGRY